MTARSLVYLVLLAACHPLQPRAQPPRWEGQSAAQLRLAPEFRSLPLSKRKLPGGDQVWVFYDCETSFERQSGSEVIPSETRCCNHRFLISYDQVIRYSRDGVCEGAP